MKIRNIWNHHLVTLCSWSTLISLFWFEAWSSLEKQNMKGNSGVNRLRRNLSWLLEIRGRGNKKNASPFRQEITTSSLIPIISPYFSLPSFTTSLPSPSHVQVSNVLEWLWSSFPSTIFVRPRRAGVQLERPAPRRGSRERSQKPKLGRRKSVSANQRATAREDCSNNNNNNNHHHHHNHNPNHNDNDNNNINININIINRKQPTKL